MTVDELRTIKNEYENKLIDLLNEFEAKSGCEVAAVDIQNTVESMEMATMEKGSMTVRKQLNLIVTI